MIPRISETYKMITNFQVHFNIGFFSPGKRNVIQRYFYPEIVSYQLKRIVKEFFVGLFLLKKVE